MDLVTLYPVATQAVQRARSGEGPTLIEARAYRYLPNTSNGGDTRYRSREEVEEWRKRDPVARLGSHLLQANVVSDADLEAIEARAREEVAEAAAWAEAQSDAEPGDALLHTWFDRPVTALGWMS
jgi:2-oxoisovalerate dehydrogenase E1 component alpha subunit